MSALEKDATELGMVGRDPRNMTADELNALGHVKSPILSVIRAKCLDCAQSLIEVRRCTAVKCPLWPYRMNSNPFAVGREMTPEQRAAASERLRNAMRPRT